MNLIIIFLFLWQFLLWFKYINCGPLILLWPFDIICCLLFKVFHTVEIGGGCEVNRRWEIKVTEDKKRKRGQTDVNKRKKESACCYHSSSLICSSLPYPACISSLQRHTRLYITRVHSCIYQNTTLIQITGFRFQQERKPPHPKDGHDKTAI